VAVLIGCIRTPTLSESARASAPFGEFSTSHPSFNVPSYVPHPGFHTAVPALHPSSSLPSPRADLYTEPSIGRKCAPKFSFIYDGNRVNDDDTPESLDLEDGECIPLSDAPSSVEVLTLTVFLAVAHWTPIIGDSIDVMIERE
jgi:hypothetical protein